MPLYDYRCIRGHIEERFARPDETMLVCGVCGSAAERQFHASFGINMGPVGAHGRYFEDGIEGYAGTNAEFRELCRRKNVSPKGDTPKPEGQRWV